MHIFLPEDFHGFWVLGFELWFTDKEITAWGGMGLMKRMLDRIGFQSAVNHVNYRSRGVIGVMHRFSCYCSSCCRYGVARTGLSRQRLHGMIRYSRSYLASNAWRILKQSCDCLGSLTRRQRRRYLVDYTAGFSAIFTLSYAYFHGVRSFIK